MLRRTFGVLLFTLCAVGCAGPVPDPSARLLAMAAQEAAGIPAPLDRFSRQLNIADTQIRMGRKADADATLMLARETLTSSGNSFDSFHQIAGWTAIAQLATSAGDRELALKSVDQAQACLSTLTPMSERAQYVLSLASVIAELRSKADATSLLVTGAGWAADLPTAERHAALSAFAYRLISYDAFDAARDTLRKDPDAAWRTDTFLAMANGFGPYPATPVAGAFAGGAGGGGVMATERQTRAPSSYGKDVRFESVFKQ